MSHGSPEARGSAVAAAFNGSTLGAEHGNGRDSYGLEEMAAVLSMSHGIGPLCKDGFISPSDTPPTG
jgi:hypothetical protein